MIKSSEEDGVWDSQRRRNQLYQSRHWHINDAIMRDLPIYGITLNCGTSDTYVNKTYSHLTTKMMSSVLNKNQSAHSMKEETKKKISGPSR